MDTTSKAGAGAPHDNPHGNLLADVPADRAAERFDALLERPGLKIERIVRMGAAVDHIDQWQRKQPCVIATEMNKKRHPV